MPKVGRASECVAQGVFMLLTLLVPALQATPTNTFYQASWASVDQHNPSPAWFQDAKFGIYFHWGVFSVPAYENEWYPRNMYNTGDGAYSHHLATFGNPFTNSTTLQFFPYYYFINGATNLAGQFMQFAPKLKSAGGNWDPDAWAQLFVNAGARFAGPVAEHHDGFSMWASTVAKGRRPTSPPSGPRPTAPRDLSFSWPCTMPIISMVIINMCRRKPTRPCSNCSGNCPRRRKTRCGINGCRKSLTAISRTSSTRTLIWRRFRAPSG